MTTQAVNLSGPSRSLSASHWQQAFLTARSDTIWGGTSESQRDILAERVLGLPRETRGTA